MMSTTVVDKNKNILRVTVDAIVPDGSQTWIADLTFELCMSGKVVATTWTDNVTLVGPTLDEAIESFAQNLRIQLPDGGEPIAPYEYSITDIDDDKGE